MACSAHLKAKPNMRDWLRSRLQRFWSRSDLRSRASLKHTPCHSSHLEFLNPLIRRGHRPIVIKSQLGF